MSFVSRRALFALLVVLALAGFAGLDHRKLIQADEGRYAEIPREMAASGDWLTPRLNGFKYFEKPPLQYWGTAAAYTLFGVGEWQARLWTALTGFLGVLIAFFAAQRLYGATTGLYAAAVLGGSVFYAMMGHFLTLDMGLSFFLSAAVFALVLAQRESASPSARRAWMLAAWAAMALAVLSKGLVGIVLPVAAVGLYILWQWDWRLLARLHIGAGLALFLVIAAPWFVAVSLANPEFAHFFFVQEHFQRFLTKMHHRFQPMWYFVPILALGIMPWLPALGAALARTAREGTRSEGAAARGFHPERLLFAWCVAVFAFFSLSSSKLPAYILPIFPALAVLVGRELARGSRALLIAQAALALAAGAIALGVLAWLPGTMTEGYPAPMVAAYRRWLEGGAIAIALFAAVALRLAWRGRSALSVLTLAAAGFIFARAVTTGYESMTPLYSAYHSIQPLRGPFERDAPFYAVQAYDHSLPFYLGRTVTMVRTRDEMARAVAWEPEKFVPSVAAFAQLWRAPGKAYAAFAPEEFEALRREHALEGEIIARGPRYVILAKP